METSKLIELLNERVRALESDPVRGKIVEIESRIKRIEKILKEHKCQEQ
jgi:hypothetical protein